MTGQFGYFVAPACRPNPTSKPHYFKKFGVWWRSAHYFAVPKRVFGMPWDKPVEVNQYLMRNLIHYDVTNL